AIGHSYNFSFTDPYWTVDGVSRTWNIFQSRVSSLTINSSPLTTQSYGGGLSFNIPLSEYSAWGEGVTYSHNELLSTNGTSQEYIKFMQTPGNGSQFFTVGACQDPLRSFFFVCQFPALRYNTLENALSYVYYTENRVIFPTAGVRDSLVLTTAIPGGDLEYAILSYQQYAFLPLPFKFIYALNGQVSYGAPYGK